MTGNGTMLLRMRNVLVGSLAVVGLINLFFYPPVLGVGLGFLFLIIHGYLFFTHNKSAKNIWLARIISVVCLLLTFSIGVKAYGPWTAINILTALGLTAAAGVLYKTEEDLRYRLYYLVITPWLATISWLVGMVEFIGSLQTAKLKSDRGKIVVPIVRGLVIAFPILAILFGLLTQADPIFRQLIGKIAINEIELRISVSFLLLVLFYIWGLAKISAGWVRGKGVTVDKERYWTESLIVSGLIVFLFAGFLAVQFKFLFLRVPEIDLIKYAPNIRTYSEYCRHGFFQLLLASGIAGAVVATVLSYLHNFRGMGKSRLQAILAVLVLETELLLVSAGWRLVIYGQAHGLTWSRFLGAVLLIWLSGQLVIMLVSIGKKINQKTRFVTVMGLTVIAYLTINLFPIDRLIAKKYPPTVNGSIDYVYLVNLSNETAEFWPEYLREISREWAGLKVLPKPGGDWDRVYRIRRAVQGLSERIVLLDLLYGDQKDQPIVPIERLDRFRGCKENCLSAQKKWQRYNLAGYRAYRIVNKNRQEFAQLGELISQINQQVEVWNNIR